MKARKLMGMVASLLVAVNASGDVVKGWVRLEATPSIVDGDRFDVYAVRVYDTFGASVYVSAMSGWSLVSSSPLQMRGGDYAGCTVRRKPAECHLVDIPSWFIKKACRILVWC